MKIFSSVIILTLDWIFEFYDSIPANKLIISIKH